MKSVILAGGYGTRLAEETHIKPKPMIEIGGKPILWHIMKHYSHYGINDFIICCGYKSYVIKEYFANYFLHTSDVTIDVKNNDLQIHKQSTEPWKITLVNTGEHTLTGGRLKRISNFIEKEECFCLTYGDGLADINISASIEFHKKNKKLVTVTAVRPPGRFGSLLTNKKGEVINFMEKPEGDGQLINGGFFVVSPKALDYIDGDNSAWEVDPMLRLAQDSQLMAFNHYGFWQPMDTLRDKNKLEELWESGNAPWKLY